MPAMSTDMSISTNGKARNFPFYRTFPRLIRDLLKEIEQIGKMSGGDLVRVGFGVFRAYVATHPDHVQHILRDNSANFLRGRPPATAGHQPVQNPDHADPHGGHNSSGARSSKATPNATANAPSTCRRGRTRPPSPLIR